MEKEEEVFEIPGLGLGDWLMATCRILAPAYFLICPYATWNFGVPRRTFPLSQNAAMCLVEDTPLKGQ